MTRLQRVLIMAGGTGGHVFPGLALADYFRNQQIEVHWLGTWLGLEAELVPKANIPLHCIEVKGVRGKGVARLLAAPWQIAKAIRQAHAIINKIQPDLAIGMGGFASGPGGIACWLSRRPLIIHEQNAIAGFTNKILAHFATYVCEGFPGAFKPQTKVVFTGNPVRSSLLYLPTPNERFAARTSASKQVLVLGGSLGAHALNTLVPQALALLPLTLRPRVIHQTGAKHLAKAEAAYGAANVAATIVPFIEDMAAAYATADMVLCRAGALTVAELCAVGLGAMLVPFPHAVDDHQTANADFMVRHQAAICLPEAALTAAQLAAELGALMRSPTQCLQMAQAAYQLRHDRVAEQIFRLCEEIEY